MSSSPVSSSSLFDRFLISCLESVDKYESSSLSFVSSCECSDQLCDSLLPIEIKVKNLEKELDNLLVFLDEQGIE
jgi:hypothetical protein